MALAKMSPCLPLPGWPHPSHSHFSENCKAAGYWTLQDIGMLPELREIQDIIKPERLKGFRGGYDSHPHFTDVATEDQRKHLSKAAQLEPEATPQLSTLLCSFVSAQSPRPWNRGSRTHTGHD